MFHIQELAVFGRFPKYKKRYLIACDSLAYDFGVFINPYIGGSASAEHACENLAEHGKYIYINWWPNLIDFIK